MDRLINGVRALARPFTQYVVTVAFAVGMFMKLDYQTLVLAAGLLGWHGWLRSRDKAAGVGSDPIPAADAPGA